MGKMKSANFMIAFVKDYLSGKSDRLTWDLDFNHYLIEHYPKMERDDPELAECFGFYLSDEGFDRAEHLPDEEHKEFIRKQFDKFNAAIYDELG